MNSDVERPCGCREGVYLCVTAEALWNAVGQAYWSAKRTGNWPEYDAARERYEQHMEGENA